MSANVDLTARRLTVGSIINFANQSLGASWELVQVMELMDGRTVMTFDLTTPFRDIHQRRVSRVEIAITSYDPPEHSTTEVRLDAKTTP